MRAIQRIFKVPKMEVLNLIRLFWGVGFPYISLTYSLQSNGSENWQTLSRYTP